MDLFFEVYLFLKDDYCLWRIVRSSIYYGIQIKIFSGDDLIVIVDAEIDQVEYAYLMAALHLTEWAMRNEKHASSSTRKGDSEWLEKLKEQLGEENEVDNAAEG